MKWSFSLSAENKNEAHERVGREGSNAIAEIVHQAIDTMPEDRRMTVSCHGEIQELKRELKKGEPVPSLHGEINLSVKLG